MVLFSMLSDQFYLMFLRFYWTDGKIKIIKTAYQGFYLGYVLQLFSVLEREQPKYRHKVTGISCDIAAPALALSGLDRQLLAREVTVVFHGAATVRFDEKLKIAYYINVRGSEEMLSLAKEMKNLKVCLNLRCHQNSIDHI